MDAATRIDFAKGDWIVCRHFPSQIKTGLGPWTVAQVREVHETKLMLTKSAQATTASRSDPKPHVLKTRVQGKFLERDTALKFMAWLQEREIAYMKTLTELDVEFAHRRAKLLSDHLGETQ